MHTIARLCSFASLLLVSLCLAASSSAVEKGRPTELERLMFMVGVWEVTAHEPDNEGTLVAGAPIRATTRTVLDDSMIETTTQADFGGGWTVSLRFTWSYDQFNDLYRVAVMDGGFGFMGVSVGTWEGDALVLRDERTGTSVPSGNGFRAYGRISVQDIALDSYTLLVETSADSGENWSVYGRYDYRKLGSAGGDE